ncbi:MAG: hypothetical protein HY454_00935 [Parcubacteria group bacterium]|nr:hypothetical protein [Parcubacteria group bacterium]
MNDRDLEDLNFEKAKWDLKSLKESGVDFWTRFLLRVLPLQGIRRLSRRLGVDPDVADKAHALFENIEKVDLVPLQSGQRGFQLILDQSTALYFYQDGDHFKYDGFEMGEYEKGDVTVFD